ncbi:protein SRG1-like [Senna tora]|uniref:Protein SRG1-like n=1 Tax=Senna tora TaxID=362788 RepID=A0A834T0X6_9FABA|nr:protein SRG1-like [Senna tora]
MDETAEAKLSKAGASLLVPSVKDLAKQPLSRIPERYLRTDVELQLTNIKCCSSLSKQVPIIDMSKLSSVDSHDSELQNLDIACKQWGFFQLMNHGVKASVIEDMKKGVEELFNLPKEEKNKLWQTPEDREGFGQQFVASQNQKLDWADMFLLVTFPQEARNSHLFPNIPLPFRDNLEAYCLEMRNLSIKIIEFMAEALNIEANEIRKLFEEKGRQAMRMNYYPPCPQPHKAMGINPHSDIGALTILLQVNEVEGLQIKKDGLWVPIAPMPNAFVINLGDVLEILSNGIYKSVEHRATVNSEKERISIATFHSAMLDGNIGPSPSLVTPQTPPLFKTIGLFELYERYLSQEVGGKSHLDFIRIQNENGESL